MSEFPIQNIMLQKYFRSFTFPNTVKSQNSNNKPLRKNSWLTNSPTGFLNELNNWNIPVPSSGRILVHRTRLLVENTGLMTSNWFTRSLQPEVCFFTLKSALYCIMSEKVSGVALLNKSYNQFSFEDEGAKITMQLKMHMFTQLIWNTMWSH